MIRVINAFYSHARDIGRPVHVDMMATDQQIGYQIPAHPLSFDPEVFSNKVFQVILLNSTDNTDYHGQHDSLIQLFTFY